MAVDAAAVRAEVGASPTNASDALLDNCIQVADALLGAYAGLEYRTGDPLVTDIPLAVADKALLAVAVEIFNQRRAPNGVLNQNFGVGPDGSSVSAPVRIGADPLRPAYGLLKQWIGPSVQ